MLEHPFLTLYNGDNVSVILVELRQNTMVFLLNDLHFLVTRQET